MLSGRKGPFTPGLCCAMLRNSVPGGQSRRTMVISLATREHLEGLQDLNAGKSCPLTPQLREPIRYLEIVALLERELRGGGGACVSALCMSGRTGTGAGAGGVPGRWHRPVAWGEPWPGHDAGASGAWGLPGSREPSPRLSPTGPSCLGEWGDEGKELRRFVIPEPSVIASSSCSQVLPSCFLP